MPQTQSEIEFIAGRLICSKVRNYLNELIFSGIPIKYYESEGFFKRKFIVRGEHELMAKVYYLLQRDVFQ